MYFRRLIYTLLRSVTNVKNCFFRTISVEDRNKKVQNIKQPFSQNKRPWLWEYFSEWKTLFLIKRIKMYLKVYVFNDIMKKVVQKYFIFGFYDWSFVNKAQHVFSPNGNGIS